MGKLSGLAFLSENCAVAANTGALLLRSKGNGNPSPNPSRYL